MTNITIKYSHSSKTKVNIERIHVDNHIVDRLTNTPVGNLEENKVYTFEKLKKLKNYISDHHNVKLEEVDSDLEEDYTDDADLLYAQGGHGCSSFDEFIERMNFPEEYE